ncbi:Cyp6a9 [Trypoxylus dichotomus]
MQVKCGGIYMYCSPILLVIDPEYIREILAISFQNFYERGFYNPEKYQPISANLFLMEGERWKTLRAKLTPTFTTAKMKIMFKSMVDAAKLLDKHVAVFAAERKPLNMKECSTRAVTDIIGNCALGVECFKDNTIQTVISECVDAATTFIKLSFCNAMPTLAQFLRVPLIPDKYVRFLTSYIDETIRHRKVNNIVRNDFLQLVMDMEDKKIISMDELRAQCVMFFLAGYESSTNATTFLLFELAYNQEIQKNLRNEILSVLDKDNGVVTYEGIMNMNYLDMVICETLRKYPTVGFLNRKCVADFKLPNTDITIEKGTKIIVPVYGLHHDPMYFPNPEKFDPERFSAENRSNIIPYTYLPFGEGPRYCIGDRFARQVIKTMVVSLIRKYKFELHTKIKYPLVLSPTGLFTSCAEEILLDVKEV